MERDFAALLLADAGVSAIVGTRVNFKRHPQGAAYPAIVLHVVDNATGYNMQGEDGRDMGRVQVDCWGDTYANALALSQAVRSALSGYRGGKFQGIFLDATRDFYEGGSNEVTNPVQISIDFMTNWSQ